MTRRISLLLFSLLALLLLAGCSEPEPDTLAEPVPLESGDSCHVCGMLISEHPGPKGEAFVQGQQTPLKFCSTMELFVFLQQPENETRLSHAYVHDIGVTPWTAPEDDAFTLASEAWYVIGHERRGSMGHTLASFAEHAAAEAFRKTYGGEVVAYGDIDLELLGQVGRGELNGH
ncbi:nitrous oxide reductase accessory protein NosL [Halomonas sediminis]